MKQMNNLILAILTLPISVGACEFTIFNDQQAGYNVVYVSLKEKLANVVSKETLKETGALRIKQHAAVKTPFTKWFDVYVPRNNDGQFERLCRVKMRYCSEDNTMKISQIEKRQINMKRFEVIEAAHLDEVTKRADHCPVHAPTYERPYQAKFEKNVSLSQPGIQQSESIVRPFGNKELLP